MIAIVLLSLLYTNFASANTLNSISSSSHEILDRTLWGGEPPRGYEKITSPVPIVIIKHTAGRQCETFKICSEIVQAIQKIGFSTGFPDIMYSFLIGGDGNIYVGRGWDAQPQQMRDSIDIAFIGNYVFDDLTTTMIEAAQILLEDGLNRNKLTDDYIIVAHNQTTATVSPGSNVYNEIIHWPHYNSKIIS